MSDTRQALRGGLLGEVDLDKMSVKVKHQPFVYVIQGIFYFSKAQNEPEMDIATDLFQRAIRCFEECLQSDPNNSISLINCAESHHKVAVLQQSSGVRMNATVLDSGNDTAQAADVYYNRALQVNPFEEELHYLYARFLERCQKWTQAEKYHLSGLEINPLSIQNLSAYAQMLRQRGEEAWANRFETRMEELHISRPDSARKLQPQPPQQQQQQLQQQQPLQPTSPLHAAASLTHLKAPPMRKTQTYM
jgi:tetratricopeptide (TPR) repeat protein